MNTNIRIARELIRIAAEIVDSRRPVLTLLIGLPGSGKSTFAKTIPNASHYEADMYFIGPDGQYVFDRGKLSEAHGWCQRMTENDLKAGKDVVVSNTGLRRWEREQYYAIAERCGARVRVKTMTGDYGNIHNVPEEALAAMKARFEPVGQAEIGEHNIEVI